MSLSVYVTNGILKLCNLDPRPNILSKIPWPCTAPASLVRVLQVAQSKIVNPDPANIIAFQSRHRTKVTFPCPLDATTALIAVQTSNVLIVCLAKEDSLAPA